MTDGQLEAKFFALAAPVLGAHRAQKLASSCWPLPALGDLPDLVALTVLQSRLLAWGTDTFGVSNVELSTVGFSSTDGDSAVAPGRSWRADNRMHVRSVGDRGSLARTPGDRVRAYARAENAACAARLAAMADMLAAAHAADGSAERDQWRCDNWAAVCAQIGAAHDVTSGVASGLLMDAVTLRERLPKVAALFAEGLISYRLVHPICTRTTLVRDPDALAALDAELAAELRARAARCRCMRPNAPSTPWSSNTTPMGCGAPRPSARALQRRGLRR